MRAGGVGDAVAATLRDAGVRRPAPELRRAGRVPPARRPRRDPGRAGPDRAGHRARRHRVGLRDRRGDSRPARPYGQRGIFGHLAVTFEAMATDTFSGGRTRCHRPGLDRGEPETYASPSRSDRARLVRAAHGRPAGAGLRASSSAPPARRAVAGAEPAGRPGRLVRAHRRPGTAGADARHDQRVQPGRRRAALAVRPGTPDLPAAHRRRAGADAAVDVRARAAEHHRAVAGHRHTAVAARGHRDRPGRDRPPCSPSRRCAAAAPTAGSRARSRPSTRAPATPGGASTCRPPPYCSASPARTTRASGCCCCTTTAPRPCTTCPPAR